MVSAPFYGGFGLLAAGGIPTAAFNDFALLHRLGPERLMMNGGNEIPWMLATRRPDGSLAIAVWNYAEPEEPGHSSDHHLTVRSGAGLRHARVTVVDAHHGSSLTNWEAMNRPAFPSREQQKTLREGGRMPAPQVQAFNGQALDLHLDPHALALIELQP